MTIFAVVVLVVYEPPLGLVTEHATESNPQPAGIEDSLTLYVVKVEMSENSFVFAVVPSSTSEKLASGDGVAVKPNDVDPFGVASLMIVIEPGKVTESADSE